MWSEMTRICRTNFEQVAFKLLNTQVLLSLPKILCHQGGVSQSTATSNCICMQSPHTMEGTFAVRCLPFHSHQHASQLLQQQEDH